MMALITESYVAQNQEMHRRQYGYGRGGDRHAQRVLYFARRLRAQSILDYGCGKGTLATGLRSLRWKGVTREYDPAVSGKSDLPKAADLVVCADVLEHIEPECLTGVLAHLRQLAKRGAFVVVQTRLSNKTLPDGRNAHLIIQPIDWWIQQFRQGWISDRIVRVESDARGERGVSLWLLPA